MNFADVPAISGPHILPSLLYLEIQFLGVKGLRINALSEFSKASHWPKT
jgi:hypothetical protein